MLGTVHFVITCARGVARPVSSAISSTVAAGKALTTTAEENKASAENALNNMSGGRGWGNGILGNECEEPQKEW